MKEFFIGVREYGMAGYHGRFFQCLKERDKVCTHITAVYSEFMLNIYKVNLRYPVNLTGDIYVFLLVVHVYLEKHLLRIIIPWHFGIVHSYDSGPDGWHEHLVDGVNQVFRESGYSALAWRKSGEVCDIKVVIQHRDGWLTRHHHLLSWKCGLSVATNPVNANRMFEKLQEDL
jgi:hypothetical protein